MSIPLLETSSECFASHIDLFCMLTVFNLLKWLCSNQPRIIPIDKIRDINSALDIDSVQNKNVTSTDGTFCIMNNIVIPAMTMLNISLKLIFSSPYFKSFYHLMKNFIPVDFADSQCSQLFNFRLSDLFFSLKGRNLLYSYKRTKADRAWLLRRLKNDSLPLGSPAS